MTEIDYKYTREYNIVSFDISGVRIDLFKQAYISVVFTFDDGDTTHKEVLLKGYDYLLWGSDDDYITKYITENLHYILGE